MPSVSSRGRSGRRMKADINVVPYIDVMLVLLVIFMVTAPLITPGLIQRRSAPPPTCRCSPLEVQISEDGKIALHARARRDDAGHRPARAGGAGAFAHHRGNPGGHRRRWQGALRVPKVMDELRTNGITRLGLLVDQSAGGNQPLPRRNANATLSRRLAGTQRP